MSSTLSFLWGCLVNENYQKQFIEDLQKSLDTLDTLSNLHFEPRDPYKDEEKEKGGKAIVKVLTTVAKQHLTVQREREMGTI